ncbi:hypothetical protein RQP46_007625 [Phenoliferia psychrophenolica]
MYGPLHAARRATVPLWLAIHLKKKRKCHIDPPAWLSVTALEETLRAELTDGAFSPVPHDYLEVSKVLLEIASDDIPTPDTIRLLLKSIREARQSKIRLGLAALNPSHLQMPHASSLELNELRGFFTIAHKRLVMLDPERELHQAIDGMWQMDPNKALNLAPEEGEDQGGEENRLVEAMRQHLLEQQQN